MDPVSALGEPSQSFGEVKSDRDCARTLGATYQPPDSLVDTAGRIVDTWEGRGDADDLGSRAVEALVNRAR